MVRRDITRVLDHSTTRFLRFAAVGSSGVFVNLAFVWVGLRVFVAIAPAVRDTGASALGIVVSVLTNFLLNDLWTWSDRDTGVGAGPWLRRLVGFGAVSAIAAAVQFGAALALRVSLAWDVYLAQLLGIGLGVFINYSLNNRWTFRDRGAP